jgi:plasmid stabilization system protein ParE
VNGEAKECQMEQRGVVRFLTLKGLKAMKSKMQLTNVDGDEALQISASKKGRRRFLQVRTKLGDDPRSGRPANSDLTGTIAEFIREHPFLSCKILCRHLRVSKEICLRFLHQKAGLKKFHLRWVPDQLTPNRKISTVAI